MLIKFLLALGRGGVVGAPAPTVVEELAEAEARIKSAIAAGEKAGLTASAEYRQLGGALERARRQARSKQGAAQRGTSAATELHGAAARMRAVLNESVRAGLVATGDREKLRQLAQSADAPAAVKGLSELHERIPKVAAQAKAKDEIAALLGAT